MPIAAERPWHLVPIGILALLWHAAGALDYLLTQIDHAPYTQQVPAEWLGYFDAMPGWVTGAWAVGVWAGLLGAVLLLLREHWAPLAMAVAFFAFAAATLWLLVLGDPQPTVGVDFNWLMISATLAAGLLWLYARAMRRRGVIT